MTSKLPSELLNILHPKSRVRVDRLLSSLGYVEKRRDAVSFLHNNTVTYGGKRLQSASITLPIQHNIIPSLMINTHHTVSLAPLHLKMYKPAGYIVSRNEENSDSPLIFDLLVSGIIDLYLLLHVLH